ncbi:MAG: recombinase family protein [Nitrospiraceae bacterium]
MHSNSTRATAVLFLRARSLGRDNPDQEQHIIAAQRASCVRTAETLGAEVIREYVEYGGTASIDTRPTLRLMLDELRALRDTTYIIVTNHDRLVRRSRDAAYISLEIEAVGAELITATSVVHTKDRKEVTV